MKKIILFVALSAVFMLSTLQIKAQEDSTLNYTSRVERLDSLIAIPDGIECIDTNDPSSLCATLPLRFTSFSQTDTVQSPNDIKSICVNMEHSFIGDLTVQIVCPNGQSSILKWPTHSGASHLGLSFDNGTSGCDTSIIHGYSCCGINPIETPTCDCSPGTGWTYCFSNQYLDSAQGVIGNQAERLIMRDIEIIDSTHIQTKRGYFQTPVQTRITTSFSGCVGPCETVDTNGFATLVGCPLNGEWKLKIADKWASDNGYIFWWQMELSHRSSSELEDIAQEGNSYIKIYPNPTKKDITIYCKGKTIENISITDMQGKTTTANVQKTSKDTYSLNLENYPYGTYIINVNADGKNESFKIMKTK